MKKVFFEQFVEQSVEAARNYVANANGKKYPRVYYSGVKSLKWGVTLQECNGVSHSAVNLPDGITNNEVNATALAMAIEDAVKRNDGSYKAFCDAMGWCQKHATPDKVTPKYIHKGIWGNEYKVSMPVTGKSPIILRNASGDTSFSGLSSALRARDTYMERVLTNRYDEAGPIADSRVRAFERELVDSAFMSLSLAPLSEQMVQKNTDNLYLALCRAKTYAEELVENGDKKYDAINEGLSNTLQLFEAVEDGWELEVEELKLIVNGMDVIFDFAKRRCSDRVFIEMKYLLYYLVLQNKGIKVNLDEKKEAIIIRFETFRSLLKAA